MFDAPTSTLYSSLNNLLDKPKEFLADVCFQFSSIEIWAHRAIILARAPNEFIKKYMPELLLEYKEDQLPLKLDKSHIIPLDLFTPLLRFWYTASFYIDQSPLSSVSDLSVRTPINASPRLPTSKEFCTPQFIQSPFTPQLDIQHEIEQLGLDLGTALLPPQSDTVPDFAQLVSDLKSMRDDNLACDVSIHLVSTDTDVILKTFKAHRFILAAQSPYFYALFCASFQEASSSNVHFTNDLFNNAIIDLMLNFFYTDKIIVEPLDYINNKTSSPHQRRLQHHKHALRVIQKAFYAADFLGHSDTLGQAILHEMECLCHQFKCVCSDCAVLLPSMLAWSDKHVDVVPQLRRALVLLYSDPMHSLAPLWSQRPFSHLVSSIVPSTSALGESTLQAVQKHDPLFRARPPKTLVHEIEERTFYNITKHNAIHALHSLHLCLSQIRTVDNNPSWSRPVLDLLTPILQYTVSMVSQFFDFYCVEYPILLSCVDGIGGGFSVDFLDFLLRHVLSDGLTENNAGVIYQGIVRDLYGRQEVVKNMAIDDVLFKARIRCAQYISKNWARVKSEGGFRTVEKSIMRQLAEDSGIPYRSLTKPFDTDFSNIFSFKPKKPKNKPEKLKEAYTRRLSIGNLMTRSSTTHSNETRQGRPRALSTESALVSSFKQYHIHTPQEEKERENQPLINMLSYETIKRAKTLEEQDLSSAIYNETPTIKHLDEHHRPLLRTSSSFTSLTDQLLPVDVPQERPERPSRLKFELPVAPVRSKSPNPQGANALLQPQPRRRRASSSKREDEDPPRVGDKIELLHRPLPTLGTVKFIGPVQFAEGQYIGVELESRLGKSDGSIDGVRYFQTDPQRGLFVKPGDLKVIQSN